MGIDEHDIGGHILPGNDVFVRHPCQYEDLAPVMQATSTLKPHAFLHEAVQKGKGIRVLNDFIFGTDNAKGCTVVLDVGFEAVKRDRAEFVRLDVLLPHSTSAMAIITADRIFLSIGIYLQR